MTGGHTTSLLRWQHHLPQLREVLRKAEFVSLDLELTGLHARAEKFLGVDRCYAAHAAGARSFMPVQLGLCAARRSGSSQARGEGGISILRTPETPRATAWEEPNMATSTEKKLSGCEPVGPHTREHLHLSTRDSCLSGNDLHFDFPAAKRFRFQRMDFARRSLHEETGTWIRRPLFPFPLLWASSLLLRSFPGYQRQIEEASVFILRLGQLGTPAVYIWYAFIRQEEEEESSTLRRRIEELRGMLARASPEAPTAPRPPVGEPGAAALFDAMTEEDRQLAASVRESISTWLSKGPQEPLELPVDSPLQRLLLHSLVAAEFPQLFSSSSTRGQDRVFVVYTTESQVFEEQLRRLQGELKAVEAARGARELLEAISLERLLVVGHCCFYDFLHLYQSFIGDLPDGVGDFKKKWSQLFPSSFDTKLLAETHEALAPLGIPPTLKGLCDLMVGASVASQAEGCLVPTPRFEVEPLDGTIWRLDSSFASVVVNSSSSPPLAAATASAALRGRVFEGPEGRRSAAEDLRGRGELAETDVEKDPVSDLAHDAGYDSMMTSMVFLMQICRVLQHRGLSWEDLHFRPAVGLTQGARSPRSPVAAQDILAQFVNRVRLVRTQPPSINLGGSEEQQYHQQSRLLVMRNFPSSWQKWNIMKLWSPVWVDVQPVDSTTCWLVTRTEADARSLRTIYEMMPSKPFELMTYEDYRLAQGQPGMSPAEEPKAS
ncbi:CAF1 family protein [Cyclospora cayetanensis]|uniref:Poly(A)-specific ribonuclease PARN n=1 Tax=Cyclospora cayetanensis TaxID=88456 RepID=A0A1D3CS64_9EIME|nr:CAF1 family protein [Cyclospora cayetanensis]